MAKFAQGRFALSISDRSGLEFPYNEMFREWNGSLVHTSEFEHKHPQLELSAHPGDVQGLTNARPDRVENAVATILKPSSLNALAIEIILNLSSLLTEIKTKPDSGNFIPALKVAL